MAERHTRDDTHEGVQFIVEGSNLQINISRGRTADHDYSVVHDIAIVTRKGSMYQSVEIPHEIERELIQALIDAHHKHEKWLREGSNWSLEDGV